MPESRWNVFFLVLALAIASPAGFLAAEDAAGVAGADSEADPIGGEEFSFLSDDGVELWANYFAPERGKAKGAILFVHEPFRSCRDWSYMAQKMSRLGFAGLVFDLRGHGRSMMKEGQPLDREIFMDEDFAEMGRDLKAAEAQLRERAGEVPVQIAGADLGGSLGFLRATEDDGIVSVALLSPGLGYDGVNIISSIPKLQVKRLLQVYSVEDGYSRKSAEILERDVTVPLHTEVYYGVGHGAKMLGREPQLEVLLQSWLLGTILNDLGQALDETGKPIAGDKTVEATQLDKEAERKRLEASAKEAEDEKAAAVGEDERPKRWKLDN